MKSMGSGGFDLDSVNRLTNNRSLLKNKGQFKSLKIILFH